MSLKFEPQTLTIEMPITATCCHFSQPVGMRMQFSTHCKPTSDTAPSGALPLLLQDDSCPNTSSLNRNTFLAIESFLFLTGVPTCHGTRQFCHWQRFCCILISSFMVWGISDFINRRNIPLVHVPWECLWKNAKMIQLLGFVAPFGASLLQLSSHHKFHTQTGHNWEIAWVIKNESNTVELQWGQLFLEFPCGPFCQAINTLLQEDFQMTFAFSHASNAVSFSAKFCPSLRNTWQGMITTRSWWCPQNNILEALDFGHILCNPLHSIITIGLSNQIQLLCKKDDSVSHQPLRWLCSGSYFSPWPIEILWRMACQQHHASPTNCFRENGSFHGKEWETVTPNDSLNRTDNIIELGWPNRDHILKTYTDWQKYGRAGRNPNEMMSLLRDEL